MNDPLEIRRAREPNGAALVLVVEDDDDARRLVAHVVTQAGMNAVTAANGREALRVFYARHPDLVVLDLGLPDIDGGATLAQIRNLSDVPVLMLTGDSSESAKIESISQGADDYLTKPFTVAELEIRMKALLRRAALSSRASPEVLHDELLTIDIEHTALTVNDRPVSLTPLEFRLATALVRNAGIIMSHDQLIEEVWGMTAPSSRDQLKTLIRRLRNKLRDAAGAEPIESVRGFGYRYSAGS